MGKSKNISNLERSRIKMELRTGHNYSYYVDANGLLKGEWGGFKDYYGKGENGEHIYGIYYKSEYIPINEFGFFYNKFDCRKFDAVRKFTEGLFICEKNNLYGIINDDCINILPIAHENILPLLFLSDVICIVTIGECKYIYNISTGEMSAKYDDILFDLNDCKRENQFIFKLNEKYGIINKNGNVILQAKYEFSCQHGLYQTFHGLRFNIFVKSGMLYGCIPIDKYDNCLYVGRYYDFNGFFIIESQGKYGLLTHRKECITEPSFDDIIFPNKEIWKGSFRNKLFKSFVIAKKNNKFWLYSIGNKKCILENCDNIEYLFHHEYGLYAKFVNKGKTGYVMCAGFVLSPDNYEEIIIDYNHIYLTKNGKKGLLDINGCKLLPCIYDDIKIGWKEFTVTIDGKQEIIDYNRTHDINYNNYAPQHYGRYSGSYAQEEMGYSDEDIDTIFDGDPTAYWNID